MAESVYERTWCGVCEKRLTRGNCDWRDFPGICRDCAPPSVPNNLPVRRPIDWTRDDGDTAQRPEDEWGSWCADCPKRGKCKRLCAPLAGRLASRLRRRRSVKDYRIADIDGDAPAMLYEALYGGQRDRPT